MNKYKPVIGLEIHVELATKSKMFCQCSADYFGKKPNTHTCPVCLGLPGALPVPNKQAIDWVILIGQALGCKVNKTSKFDRKHYFYPDLPKGYQISQYDEPFNIDGSVVIGEKTFGITRVHMEEDTGKLTHLGGDTLVDFNRSGVPLVEIVTEPDFENAEDVKRFLEELQVTIRYLGVSDADMEKGSMRLEPNISLRKEGESGLPKYKVEVKNINSFNFVKKAVEYEIERQTEMLERGEVPAQETRGYNEAKGITVSQRTKEEAHDYRYFPEPDIPPFQFTDEEIGNIEKQLPELPSVKTERFVTQYKIKPADALQLTRDKKVADYFEKVSSQIGDRGSQQQIANLIINKKLSTLLPVEEFVNKAVEILTPKIADAGALKVAVEKIIGANTKAIEDYKNGKENSLMFLVGQVMREMKGQADAVTVKEVLIKKIKEV